jgi:GalNAc-alpha-(1->4)-GalNAc-alpha-(1->3)-diNAcBac-PP-undecaprenol alpha-1,4-N-acetyl-D-galactosaminyltransferase
MRICCVMAQMTAGGAERVMSELCNNWADTGNDVALLVFADPATDFYQLHPSIRRISPYLRTSRSGTRLSVGEHLARILALRRAIVAHRPDVVLSFINATNTLTLIATRGLNLPVVVSERVYPPLEWTGALRRLLRKVSYRLADVLVVQTEAAARWGEHLGGVRRIEVIANPLSTRFERVDGATADARDPIVVAMGRLQPQKGFDVLIRAFASASEGRPNWRLHIYGAGPDEQDLRAMTGQFAPGRVEFRGIVSDPERVLGAASIFVLSSRYEGFPNALLEAMASGCAVASTRCPTGPDELIRDGVDGLLVPVDNPDALAVALKRLIDEPILRRQLGAKAVEVRQRFNRSAILRRWTSMMQSVIRSPEHRSEFRPTP